MGYALYALLPSTMNITLVNLNRYHYAFDARTRPKARNTTMMVHFAGKETSPKTREASLAWRIRHAHNFSLRQSCVGRGHLSCMPFRTPRCAQKGDDWCKHRVEAYKQKYATLCHMGPDESQCPKGKEYDILPPKAKTLKKLAAEEAKKQSATRAAISNNEGAQSQGNG